MSGTSMAGPHAVGIVALLWSAQPGLIGDIDATREAIQRTAVVLIEMIANLQHGGSEQCLWLG